MSATLNFLLSYIWNVGLSTDWKTCQFGKPAHNVPTVVDNISVYICLFEAHANTVSYLE